MLSFDRHAGLALDAGKRLRCPVYRNPFSILLREGVPIRTECLVERKHRRVMFIFRHFACIPRRNTAHTCTKEILLTTANLTERKSKRRCKDRETCSTCAMPDLQICWNANLTWMRPERQAKDLLDSARPQLWKPTAPSHASKAKQPVLSSVSTVRGQVPRVRSAALWRCRSAPDFHPRMSLGFRCTWL